MKHSCGNEIPEDSAFCQHCGGRVPPGGGQGDLSDASSSNSPDFIYSLSEEQVIAGDPGRIQPDYGAVAICMVENSIHKIYGHEKYNGSNTNNHIKDVLGKVVDFFKVMGGQKTQKVSTFLMSDLRNTPVVRHRAPLKLVGKPDAALLFEFWVNPEEPFQKTGLFIQKFAIGKPRVSISQFQKIAIEEVSKIIPSYDFSRVAVDAQYGLEQGAALARDIALTLEKITGISALATYTDGRLTKREWLEVSSSKSAVVCGGIKPDQTKCTEKYKEQTRFCGVCGNNLSDPNLWLNNTRYLQAKNGDQLTVQLTMMVLEQDKRFKFNTSIGDDAAAYVLKMLAPKLRGMDLPELMTRNCLVELTELLNAQLTNEWRGFVTEFEVTDIRTSQEEWFFNTRALVQESLRSIETKKEMLKVGEAEVDLDELSFSLKMREIKQSDSEALTMRRLALESRATEAALEVQEALLNSQTSLKRGDIEDDAEKQRLAREKDKMLREREFTRDKTSAERADELSAVDHDMSLETKVARHDLDLNDLTAEAQSKNKRRDISDEFFVNEESLRIQSKADATENARKHLDEDIVDRQVNRDLERTKTSLEFQDQIEGRKETRQIDKLKAMAELEAQMAAQEHQQEMAKAQLDAEKELTEKRLQAEKDALENSLKLQKLDAMKGLDAIQMLAMQVGDLAGKGGVDLAAIVGQLTSAHATIQTKDADLEVAKAKAEAAQAAEFKQQQLYKEMLENQSKAMGMLQQNQSEAMDNMKVVASMNALGGAPAAKGDKDSILGVAEKAMDSMARVASAAAGRKGGDKDSTEKESEPKKPKSDD